MFSISFTIEALYPSTIAFRKIPFFIPTSVRVILFDIYNLDFKLAGLMWICMNWIYIIMLPKSCVSQFVAFTFYCICNVFPIWFPLLVNCRLCWRLLNIWNINLLNIPYMPIIYHQATIYYLCFYNCNYKLEKGIYISPSMIKLPN